MSYRKELKFPSIKTPGVYPDKTDKKIGLDTDDLKKLSLGNWNSVTKDNKIFSGSPTTGNGRPVLLSFDRAMLNLGIGRVTYNLVNGVKTNIKYRGKVWPNGGGDGDTGFKLNDIDDFPIISQLTQEQGYEYELVARHIAVWSNFFNRNVEEFDIQVPYDDFIYPISDVMQANYWKFDDPEWQAAEVLDNGFNDITYNTGGMRSNRNKNKVLAFIQPRNASNDSFEESSNPGESTYVQGSPIEINIPGFDNLIVERRFHINHQNTPREFTSNSYPEHGGGLIGHGNEPDNWTHELFFPLYFRLFNLYGPNEHRFFGKVINVPSTNSSDNWEFSIGKMEMEHLTSGFVSTTGLGNEWAKKVDIENSNTSTLNLDAYYWLAKLGMPTFNNNITLSDETLLGNLNVERLTFKVTTTSEEENEFLYYDQDEDAYDDTSYPVKATLNIGLYDDDNFVNQLDDLDQTSEVGNLFFIDNSVPQQETTLANTFTLSNSYFTYQVIQWGDEKILLTDDSIEDTYFLNLYNESNDALVTTNWSYKKWIASQKIATPIQISNSHVYNSSGIKPIKIIIWRYDNTKQFLLQTYLVTKNIVINDGNLKAQDFSIFGGTDFTFLPITDNQAVIGGFDVDSKYNTSVEKITKDDNFTSDDYLQRASSKDYINKINNNSLGKRPGQLDLGQTRIFKQSRDIYDFIGGDKLQWIMNGSGSLPVNSLATSIFINDDECIVDLNPSNTDYSAIQNQIGLNEVGILIGDYKLNQPKDSKVQKQEVMKTPLLDTNVDKQAF